MIDSEHEGFTLIVTKDCSPIGYVSVLFKPSYPYFSSDTAEMCSLFIFPSKRRNGFASKIINHTEKMCKINHFARVGLGVGVTKDYQAALALYTSMGYKPDGNGLYHSSLKNHFVEYQDTLTIDRSTTLWFVKELS